MNKERYKKLFSDFDSSFQVINNKKKVEEYKKQGFFIRTFSILSKTNNNIGVAIPVDNKNVSYSALSELKSFKGRSFKNRVIINFLIFFDKIFGNIIFKNKFFIAFKPQNNSIYDWLESRIDVNVQNIYFSIYRSARKHNLPLFNNLGQRIGFARLYNSEDDSLYFGENEEKILKKLQNINFENVLIPKIITSGYYKDNFVIVESFKKNLRLINSIERIHLFFLKELSEKTGKIILLKESNFFNNINSELNNFPEISDFCKNSLQKISNKNLMLSLVQREFPVHHLLKKKEDYFVIDWEHAKEEYPPIFDFFSLLISENRNISGNYQEKFIKNIENIFFDSDSKYVEIIKEMFNYYKISREDSFHLFILYLLDQAVIAKKTKSKKTTERSIEMIQRIKQGIISKRDWLTFYKL